MRTSERPGHSGAATTAATHIPFNRPSLEGREMEYIAAAVQGGHTSASGPFAKRAAELIRDSLDARDVLLTTSCTDALELSAMLLDLEPGDTVVVPSFTFVSTALAYVRAGARLLFCDVEPVTLGLDPQHLAELMDDSVRAVVPVHYAGVGCDLDGILTVLSDHPRAHLIEDNAHGLFGRYRQRPLGTFGRFSTLSFHETKNFICGEGGALVVNDAADVDRAHVLYDKGTNRRAFMHGMVDKYSWQDTGSSFGLSEVLAAYLYAQLEEREHILAARRQVFEGYRSRLEPLAAEHGFTTQQVPADRDQAYHMFYVLLPDAATRDRVLDAMHVADVNATFHYVPLHSSAGARRYAARPTACPVTDDVSGRLVRLPFHNGLTDAQIDRVTDVFLSALAS